MLAPLLPLLPPPEKANSCQQGRGGWVGGGRSSQIPSKHSMCVPRETRPWVLCGRAVRQEEQQGSQQGLGWCPWPSLRQGRLRCRAVWQEEQQGSQRGRGLCPWPSLRPSLRPRRAQAGAPRVRGRVHGDLGSWVGRRDRRALMIRCRPAPSSPPAAESPPLARPS